MGWRTLGWSGRRLIVDIVVEQGTGGGEAYLATHGDEIIADTGTVEKVEESKKIVMGEEEGEKSGKWMNVTSYIWTT